MKENNIILEKWNVQTNKLKDYFVDKYFGIIENPDCYWVADEIGGVLYINDYFFNLSDIVDYIKYRYSKDKMFKNYEYRLKCLQNNEIPINIKNWIKLKK